MRYVKKCPKCENELHYDDERDAYCCLLCQICIPSFGHKKVDKVDKDIKKENNNADN